MSVAEGPALVTIAAGVWCDPVTGLCAGDPVDEEGPADEGPADGRVLTPPSH